MIRCRRCEQWFMPGDPRTSTVVIIDGAPTPSCHHFGLRVATADEIYATNQAISRVVDDRDGMIQSFDHSDAGPRCGWG